jgi:hypothetical protein
VTACSGAWYGDELDEYSRTSENKCFAILIPKIF